MSYKEIAAALGISKSRVFQLEKSALAKLRRRAPWLLFVLRDMQQAKPKGWGI